MKHLLLLSKPISCLIHNQSSLLPVTLQSTTCFVPTFEGHCMNRCRHMSVPHGKYIPFLVFLLSNAFIVYPREEICGAYMPPDLHFFVLFLFYVFAALFAHRFLICHIYFLVMKHWSQRLRRTAHLIVPVITVKPHGWMCLFRMIPQ